jgi:aldehyde dehydrogenase (NAD+)
VTSKSGETLTVCNPYDDSIVTSDVQVAGPEDIDAVVSAAKIAFKTGPWSKFTGAQRSACMLKFADLAEQNMERLALLESAAMGKPVRDLYGFDIPHMVGCYRCKSSNPFWKRSH